MQLSVDQEIEAAIARAMPAARRIFGRSARMRIRQMSFQVGYFSESGFHLRGSASIPTPDGSFKNLTQFRSMLDAVTAEALASVRPFSDDPKP